MSFSETCVHPRLLFGRFLQAYCKRGEVYHKSILDLNECLRNDNGKFTSNIGKTRAFDFPRNCSPNVRLDGSKIIAELPGGKKEGQIHATYDLDVCLCNEDGELKWVVQDGPLDRDGGITKAVEAIPGLGIIVAGIHKRNNNSDHAKRALTLSSKGLFAILFGIFVIELGGFDPTMAPIVGFISFLGTVIADLTIETAGRAWIKNKRIAADIPDRTWSDTFLDGLVAGVAVGAATGIAPHAEEAAVRALRSAAIVPEEMAIAEVEMLSVQNLMYNAPKLGREIAKAATGGVVRASPSGIQMLTARTPGFGCASSGDGQDLSIQPGVYYIAHAQTGRLLQMDSRASDGVPQLQAGKAHFEASQMWIVERINNRGEARIKIKSLASKEYIGSAKTGGAVDSPYMTSSDAGMEFLSASYRRDGISLAALDDYCRTLDLDLELRGDNLKDALPVRFITNVAEGKQTWLFEEANEPDLLELYHGAIVTNTELRISHFSTGVPLHLNNPRGSKFISWSNSGKPASTWVLEAGFTGYYLRHTSSGLYMLAGKREKDVKTLPLSLGHMETQFILDGNDEDGYSIVYAPDSSYGLEIDDDMPSPGSHAILSWKLDTSHTKWRVGVVE